MLAYTYIEKGKFALVEKSMPRFIEAYRVLENKLDGVIKVAII